MEGNNTTQQASAWLECAMDIGEMMMLCGAEIHRVEDTLCRIGYAYGADQVDVFAITYAIVVTIRGEGYGSITQTRRIQGFRYNLNELSELNALSREICATRPDSTVIKASLMKIQAMPKYNQWQLALGYAIISAAFAIFFGGTMMDAVVAGGIGLVIKVVELPLNRMAINRFIVVGLCAAAAGALALTMVQIGIGQSAEKIGIGNIMVLIPGLMFTNAIRDMAMDNILSGSIRLCEAIGLAVAIACGFALANFTFGGL